MHCHTPETTEAVELSRARRCGDRIKKPRQAERSWPLCTKRRSAAAAGARFRIQRRAGKRLPQGLVNNDVR